MSSQFVDTFVVSQSSQPADAPTTSEVLPAPLTVLELMSHLICCQISSTVSWKRYYLITRITYIQ